MNKLHLNIPETLTDTFRVLPKRCRKFDKWEIKYFMDAINHGMKMYPQGFRVFRQRTYEWYEPLNIEVAKIAEKKEWNK